MKIRKKPIVLDAEFATEDGSIDTPEGTLVYLKDDAIVTGVRGERYPIRRDIFEETYDLVADEAPPDPAKFCAEPVEKLNDGAWRICGAPEVDGYDGHRCEKHAPPEIVAKLRNP